MRYLLKWKITGTRGVLHRQRDRLERRADRDQQAGASPASRRELGVDQAELGHVHGHPTWPS